MSDTPTGDGLPAVAPGPAAGEAGEAGERPVPEAEGRPSRRSTWLAMGAVAVALGSDLARAGHRRRPAGGRRVGRHHHRVSRRARRRPSHRQAGAAALHAQGHERRRREAGLVQGQGHPAELLGDVVRALQGRDSRSSSSCRSSTRTTSSCWASRWTTPSRRCRPYAAQYKINYPLLVGNGREDVQEAFGPLCGIPVSVIIGRDGKIAKKHSGIATKAQFEREIKALL